MPLIHDHADGSRSTVSLFGRVIGWREYGDPSGVPVLFLHGWPGSSAQGICVDGAAQTRGLRIISIDRPGMGRSSRIPGRRFMDFPPLAAAVMATSPALWTAKVEGESSREKERLEPAEKGRGEEGE